MFNDSTKVAMSEPALRRFRSDKAYSGFVQAFRRAAAYAFDNHQCVRYRAYTMRREGDVLLVDLDK